jgi:hypothetical protein
VHMLDICEDPKDCRIGIVSLRSEGLDVMSISLPILNALPEWSQPYPPWTRPPRK